MPPRALRALRMHWRRLPAKLEAVGSLRHSTGRSSELATATSKVTASCALEIPPAAFKVIRAARPQIRSCPKQPVGLAELLQARVQALSRSEERRVGKEC